ncbi:MAG: ferredoxin [Gammaproteobacteria bacterium]|nr:ferredoxin [Gammaproteobacteria bacterium]
MPAIPAAQKDASSDEDILYTLRHFHLGDPGARKKTEAVGNDYLPALLNIYRDASKIRYDYPIFLYPPGSVDPEPGQLTQSIVAFLREGTESFAPGAESARILKDNLPRLERSLRKALREKEGPVDARTALSAAGQELLADLKLDKESGARLQADFDKLLKAVPNEGQILGYGRYAAIHLMHHAICSSLIPRRAGFRRQVEERIRGLKTLLEVEWSKSDEAIEPKQAQDSVGAAGDLFNPAALSEVMGSSRGGSVEMTDERRARIQGALQVLEEYWQAQDPILVRFVHLQGKLKDGEWVKKTPTLATFTDPDPCTRATALFDEQTSRLAKVFAAARIALLEIDNKYTPAVHAPWFANFTWEAFSKEEMLLAPAVIALESADRMAGEGMQSLSHLLSSGRPVQILVRVQAHNNPRALSNEDPLANYRVELGHFGIAHRQAVVSQSSAARHEHLLAQFLTALDATRTSLHLINTGVQNSIKGVQLNAWLVAGAALESRAHPFFHINPEAGDSAKARMNFSGNPQPESDWPRHPFVYRNETGETANTKLAFTFADYALLIPRLRDNFRLVPLGCESEDLVTADTYLSEPPPEEDADKRIPFIWVVNDRDELRKAMISRTLIFACRDRQNYWHTLQELAGIHSKYVEDAVQATRAELQAQARAEQERLVAEHTAELDKIRDETAAEAMQRLTSVLLGMDLSATAVSQLAPTAKAAPAAAPSEAPAEQAEAEAVPEEEEDEVSFDDPWIDGVLCTSCNDCMKVNSMLFLYDDNKQAVLGDLGAGTYAHLVQAAEICPAKCIHPGKPQNPGEPGLDDLIKRAEPFNQ